MQSSVNAYPDTLSRLSRPPSWADTGRERVCVCGGGSVCVWGGSVCVCVWVCVCCVCVYNTIENKHTSIHVYTRGYWHWHRRIIIEDR